MGKNWTQRKERERESRSLTALLHFLFVCSQFCPVIFRSLFWFCVFCVMSLHLMLALSLCMLCNFVNSACNCWEANERTLYQNACMRITVQHFGWCSRKPMSMPANVNLQQGERVRDEEINREKCRLKQTKRVERKREREMHLTIFIWTMTILSLKYTISCMCTHTLHAKASLSLSQHLVFRAYVCEWFFPFMSIFVWF